jgi:hypothetical protein
MDPKTLPLVGYFRFHLPTAIALRFPSGGVTPNKVVVNSSKEICSGYLARNVFNFLASKTFDRLTSINLSTGQNAQS